MSENKIDCVIQYLKDDDFRYHMEDATPYKELSVEERDILSTYITQLQQENQQLKDNWNKLFQWLIEQEEKAWDEVSSAFSTVSNKMREIERGTSNVKD